MNIASLAAFLDALDSLPVLTTAQRAAEVAAALLSAKHPGSRNQLSVQVARALVAPVRPGTPTPIAAAAQFPAAQPVGNSPRTDPAVAFGSADAGWTAGGSGAMVDGVGPAPLKTCAALAGNLKLRSTT
jgi:hypothetical protein